MYHIAFTNGAFEIKDISNENNSVSINNLNHFIDIKKVGEKKYHLIFDNASFYAEVLNFDEDANALSLLINGKKVDCSFKTERDLLLQKLGLSGLQNKKLDVLKAPMPGLVVEINVNVGDDIDKGDALLVLEAMKMENIIKAPLAGKVKKINIAPKQAVEKNQVLIEFE